MVRANKATIDPDDAPLKRLGGGRWETRDGRFAIEPQSGTWVVVDAEQTDDLGMALVRGPFPSLTAAKEAIAGARASEPAASPLAERLERHARRLREPGAAPQRGPAAGRIGNVGPSRAAAPDDGIARAGAEDGSDATSVARPAPGRSRADTREGKPAPPRDEEPREPAWLADLEPAKRGRARRLIARLRDDDEPDAEGLARRDLVGDVPALAALAISRRLAGLGDDASPDDVADLLADGRDEGLGVRWRLVDGDGRPIVLDPSPRRCR